MVRVPVGGSLELEVQLEDVSDGILVTASVVAPLVGECARCLEEFTSVARVRFQELFASEAGGSGDDGYLLDSDLLDLEPALRDAVVLELPLSPLCTADCPGLCSRCGVRLADAEPGHGHASEDGAQAAGAAAAWPAGQAGGTAGRGGRQNGSSSGGTTGPAGTKER